ncbi:hypothetical protein [Streptomyces sp. NPDC001422]|uniref:hypothetical protein n=1 Tax=unclassified Streptomyces TaxID=2593676 RepID=UPI0036BC02A4
MFGPSRALEHRAGLDLHEETAALFPSGDARRVFPTGDHSWMLEPQQRSIMR